MANLDKIAYGGWNDCVRLGNGKLELVVTLGVGPRVMRYGFVGGQNLFKEFEDQLGKTQGSEWMIFGGHRLWHAPEVFPRTYAPDFDPVSHRFDGSTLSLEQRVEPTTGIEKQIEITLKERTVELKHRLINRNAWAIRVSPWCLSVMAPSGRAIVPQERFMPHPDVLTPARPLVLWHFTRMNDPRFRWGDRFIELREDASVDAKQKFGARNREGWAAYFLNGQLFIKTFACLEGAEYPDMGVNCEFYTQPGMLEVETLGPLATLEPGAAVEHGEHWHLFDGVELPDGELGLAEALAPYVAGLTRPMR